MLTNRIFRFSISLLLFLTGAFSSVQPALASGPALDPEQAQYEIDFMKDMIDHHASAVAMGGLCIKRAVHEELREMCKQVVRDQIHEIEQMQSWLKEWYDIKYRPHIGRDDRQMITHLARHKGNKFDLHFMHMMIMHHGMAIEMSQTCLTNAYHEELLNLCGTMSQTQAAEIEQMQVWLCEWYDHCDGGHHEM